MPRFMFDSLESRQLLTATQFAIDSSLSQLTINAYGDADSVGKVSLRAQSDGLDTASFGGTLVADISAKGVRFNGGSAINAIEHQGSFDPGNDDAAFALSGRYKKVITLASLDAAVRDLSLDITESSRKAITGSKHRFLIRNGEMTVNSGRVDYNFDSKFTSDRDGTESLADLKTDLENGQGRVTGKKGSRIITIPVDVTYRPDLSSSVDGVLRLKGQIVGRESATRSSQAFAGTVIAPATAAKPAREKSIAQQLSL